VRCEGTLIVPIRFKTAGYSLFSAVVVQGLVLSVLLLSFAAPARSMPIQELRGTISEVGEGFVVVKPDGETSTRKFVFRWKVRFAPPRLPLKGDHVVVLYKEKEDGPVIYGINYLKPSSPAASDVNGGGAGVPR
jgi:hypothetical protein